MIAKRDTELAKGQPQSLSGLWPFLRPYRGRIALTCMFLVLAAATTLLFPLALQGLIDSGMAPAEPGERLMAMREQFLGLFAVAAALGLFSAARLYVVTWLGERITADLRNAVVGLGALIMLVYTSPLVMVQVLGVLVLVVAPTLWFGRRIRKLSRASQDRVADSSGIAAEVLNAMPVVQSHTAEARERARFDASTHAAF